MREEILSIASDLREGYITTNEAQNLLLILFGVIQQSEQFCECNNPKGEGVQGKCSNCYRPFKTY